MIRTRETRYILSELDRIANGEAYYHRIREGSTDLGIMTLKVLLYIHATAKVKKYPFRLSSIPYKSFCSYQSIIDGVNELVNKGYFDKESRQFYKFNSKGLEFVRLFWYNHSRMFAKYTSKTVPE
jgi:predicted transcriptional regulator